MAYFRFQIPGRRHIAFHDVIRLLNCLTQKNLCTDKSGNRVTAQNPKWRSAGNLKAKIGGNNF